MNKLVLSIVLLLACSFLQAAGNNDYEVVVYKTPYCGCCSLWADHMKANGFSVIEVEVDDIGTYKQQHGIPDRLASCHTALVEGYVIEGHVPAADVSSLLQDRPDIHGLSVPGMPIGSPGMEQGDRVQAYAVLAIRKDGSVYTYNTYEER